jgi:hypothetical protein
VATSSSLLVEGHQLQSPVVVGPSLLVMLLCCPTELLNEDDDDDDDDDGAGNDDHNKNKEKDNDNKKVQKPHQCNNQPVKELNSYWWCWCGCHAADTHSRRFASPCHNMAIVSGAMMEACLILFVIDSLVSQFFCSRRR